MSKMNPIKKYMTKSLHTIGEDIPLSKAIEMMREHRIRHLPVQYAGKIVGLLSDRDIQLALTVRPSAKDLEVGDVMTEHPYSVSAECPLEQVAQEMSKNKFGCAIIENEQGRAIGIFTAVDGMGLLGEWLRKKNLNEPQMRLISQSQT